MNNLKVRTRSFSNRKTQMGQAAVEYILMLIVTVSMLFLARSLFTNGKQFIDSYIGDYVACLMDYGELPSLGVSDESLKQHTHSGYKCDSKFSNFSWNTGRTPVPESSSGLNRSTGSSSSGKSSMGGNRNTSNSSERSNNDRNSSSKSSERSSANSSDELGGGSNSSSQGLAGRSASNPIRNSRNPYGTADGATTDQGNVRLLEDDPGAGRGLNPPSEPLASTRYRTSDRYRAITGAQAEEIEKNSKVAKKEVNVRSIALQDEGFRSGPRKSEFKIPEKKPDYVMEDKDDGLSFGYLLKWLLIAGMIVAVIVFFGGQILNYSKSDN